MKKVFVKYIGLGILIYLLDVSGIFTHIFERDFALYFNWPLHNGSTNNQMASKVGNLTFIYSSSTKCENAPYLMLIIKSAVGNSQRRAYIRRTWGFEQRFSDVVIRRVFLVGITPDVSLMKIVNKEADMYNDIVQLHFHDTYFNNTIKMLLGMRWALKYCSNGQYFLFVDDDYYLSTKNLLRFIYNPACYSKSIFKSMERVSPPTDEALFAGFVFQTAPLRQKISKWYVPLEEYPFDMWPPYVTAGAFVLSRNALFQLYHASLSLPLFRFDDIFMGMVALKSNLVLTHCDMFHFQKPIYAGPESYRYVIASHGFDNSEEMENVWAECHSAGYA